MFHSLKVFTSYAIELTLVLILRFTLQYHISPNDCYPLISAGLFHTQIKRFTMVNLQYAMNRVWTCTEPEFRLSWIMKLYRSDSHYTATPKCSSKFNQMLIPELDKSHWLTFRSIIANKCLKSLWVGGVASNKDVPCEWVGVVVGGKGVPSLCIVSAC